MTPEHRHDLVSKYTATLPLRHQYIQHCGLCPILYLGRPSTTSMAVHKPIWQQAFQDCSEEDALSSAVTPTGQKPQHCHDKRAFPQTRLSGKHGHFWAVYSLNLQIAQ